MGNLSKSTATFELKQIWPIYHVTDEAPPKKKMRRLWRTRNKQDNDYLARDRLIWWPMKIEIWCFSTHHEDRPLEEWDDSPRPGIMKTALFFLNSQHWREQGGQYIIHNLQFIKMTYHCTNLEEEKRLSHVLTTFDTQTIVAQRKPSSTSREHKKRHS